MLLHSIVTLKRQTGNPEARVDLTESRRHGEGQPDIVLLCGNFILVISPRLRDSVRDPAFRR